MKSKIRLTVPFDAYENAVAATCLIQVIVFVIAILLGGVSVDYLIDYFFAADIPFVFDILLGVFCGAVSMPLALGIFVLSYFGVI